VEPGASQEENREDGESPSRPRHCDRPIRLPHDATASQRWEGAAGLAVSQETCLVSVCIRSLRGEVATVLPVAPTFQLRRLGIFFQRRGRKYLRTTQRDLWIQNVSLRFVLRLRLLWSKRWHKYIDPDRSSWQRPEVLYDPLILWWFLPLDIHYLTGRICSWVRINTTF